MIKQELIEQKANEIQGVICDGGVFEYKQTLILEDGNQVVTQKYTWDSVLIVACEIGLDDELRKFYNNEENRLQFLLSDALESFSNELAKEIVEDEKE